MILRIENAAARIDSARAALAENPSRVRLQRRVAAAEAAYRDIRDLDDSTPGGQSELRAAIAAEPDPDRRVDPAPGRGSAAAGRTNRRAAPCGTWCGQ